MTNKRGQDLDPWPRCVKCRKDGSILTNKRAWERLFKCFNRICDSCTPNGNRDQEKHTRQNTQYHHYSPEFWFLAYYLSLCLCIRVVSHFILPSLFRQGSILITNSQAAHHLLISQKFSCDISLFWIGSLCFMEFFISSPITAVFSLLYRIVSSTHISVFAKTGEPPPTICIVLRWRLLLCIRTKRSI